MTGIVFDVKEFTVHDGDGGRITVFMKGCPLSCVWCHNPEGLSCLPEMLYKKHLCKGCGLCLRDTDSPDYKKFGRNIKACPDKLLSISGKEYTPKVLVDKLLPFKKILTMLGGGITFSGGEPLLQADFIAETSKILKIEGFNLAIETSGYGSQDAFKKLIEHMDCIYMDLKIADDVEHKKYTGVSNAKILKNAKLLKDSGKRHVFRTPLIEGITDRAENLEKIKQIVGDSEWELLPFNPLAGAKYGLLGREFPLDKLKKD